MENASKALIIAGAILLSILIIGLGMFIYQQAAGAMDGANLDPQKANAYNQEFMSYAGTISGANARSLYSTIASHNRVKVDDYSQQVTLTIDGGDLDEATLFEPDAAVTMPANTLKAAQTYHVTFQYNKSGYITKCNIQRVK